MGQKGTGRRLSDQERMEIIAKLEGDKPRASAADCARQYGVSSAAITKLMKMKEKIKQRFQENNAFSQQRKRGGTERHAAFEDELFQWISKQQDTRMPPPLNSAKVQEKAQELLKAHNLGTFRASKGWYYRFCRRYGLTRASLGTEEGDSVANDDGDLEGSGVSETDDSIDDVVGPSDVATGSGDTTDAANVKDEGRDTEKGKKKKADAASSKKSRHSSPKGWAGIQSLQDTLARSAAALDHPEAREYLGENAANEMLRSIQQSIGVVQCIRLKKNSPEADAAVAGPSSSAASTSSTASSGTTAAAAETVVV